MQQNEFVHVGLKWNAGAQTVGKFLALMVGVVFVLTQVRDRFRHVVGVIGYMGPFLKVLEVDDGLFDTEVTCGQQSCICLETIVVCDRASPLHLERSQAEASTHFFCSTPLKIAPSLYEGQTTTQTPDLEVRPVHGAQVGAHLGYVSVNWAKMQQQVTKTFDLDRNGYFHDQIFLREIYPGVNLC